MILNTMKQASQVEPKPVAITWSYYKTWLFQMDLSIFFKYQSNFRPGYSTQDVLLYVTDAWRKAIDEGEYVGSVFLDLTKAFDCVNYEILLTKMESLEIPTIGWEAI